MTKTVETSSLTNLRVSVNISAHLITLPEGSNFPAGRHLEVPRKEQTSYLGAFQSRIKPVSPPSLSLQSAFYLDMETEEASEAPPTPTAWAASTRCDVDVLFVLV